MPLLSDFLKSENLIMIRIIYFVENFNILNKNPFGFHHGFSTIYSHLIIIINSLDEKFTLDMSFVAYQKLLVMVTME